MIGGYVIERLLGAGGMGAVYAARHPRLPRVDAVKVLPTAVSDDPAYRARFEREAALAARLDHQNIVPVYDRGTDDGRLWMSMKLVPGPDAAQVLTGRPRGLPLDQVLGIVDAVAAALDHAHGAGLLHRDVKPGNILIDTTGIIPRVMLSDFGIAREQHERSDLTSVGMVVGTVDYASPEQLSGNPVDGRSDQYSLAGTTVQLLTGSKPYGASSGTAVIRDHLLAPPPAPSRLRPDLPPAIDSVIARAMAKSPQHRFASCREFAQALRTACAPVYPPTDPSVMAAVMPVAAQGSGSGPRRGVLIGAVAAVTVVAVSAVAALVLASGAGSSADAAPADGAASSSAGAPGAASSSPAATSAAPVNNTSTLRDGFIDPCLLPAPVIASLGISPLVDDPTQRNTAGVRFACKGVDARAANASVKFATFVSSSAWDTGTPVSVPGSDRWRSFTVPSTTANAPDFCVTAYKSLTNGVLYIGMQKVGGRDCGRGAEIAAAINASLPQ
ncbi:hypothetical protein GCM10027289_23170 [Tsukamurella serpentis]